MSAPIYVSQITVCARIGLTTAHGYSLANDTHYSFVIDKCEPAPGFEAILVTCNRGQRFITEKILVIYENR